MAKGNPFAAMKKGENPKEDAKESAMAGKGNPFAAMKKGKKGKKKAKKGGFPFK